MVINSGIVLDYLTNLGIRDTTVLAVNVSGSLIGSAITDPCGIYSLDIGNYVGEIGYIPIKDNYIGITKQHSHYAGWVDLYLRPDPGTILSGIHYVNMNNLPLSTSSRIRDTASNKSYLCVTTEAGLDIIDQNTYTNIGYINYSGGFTAVDFYTNDKVEPGLLLGTTTSGACEFIFPAILSEDNRDRTSLLKTKFKVDSVLYKVQSNNINCISRNYYNDLIFGTTSGVDYYSRSGVHYSHSYGSDLGTSCSYITDSGDLYYSPTGSGLWVKFAPISGNWENVDYKVEVGGAFNFPIETNFINKVDIRTISGENYVYLATLSGIVWYREYRDNIELTASGAKIFNEV